MGSGTTKEDLESSDTMAPTEDDASMDTIAPSDAAEATARSSSKIRPSRVIRPSGPMRIGRYVVERKLGAGGMGVVFLADDPELKRKVVIKLLRAEVAEQGSQGARDRLQREAQAMAQVSHPNVVPIYDVGIHDGQVFLAMEFIDGCDLAAWLDVPRTLRERLAVLTAAGRGLAAAHRAGLVHRDFKPHNVLLGKDGSVKVTDFGLARAEPPAAGTAPIALDRVRVAIPRGADAPTLRSSLLDSPLTQAGALVGTPAYMAPEQICAEPVDGRADQFGFCVALYEAVFGERPFRGATVDELFDSILAGKLPPALAKRRDVPEYLRDAIRRGLALQPADRFADMDALLAALVPPARPWPIIAAAVGGTIAVGAVTFVLLRGGGDDARPQVCTGGPAELASVWSLETRKQLEPAFVATKSALAPRAFTAFTAAVDSYAQAWQASYRDACEATRVRGGQTEAVMEQRMRCLRRRRAELGGLIEIARKPDDDFMTDTAGLVAKLESPRACDNVEALDKTVADPAQQAAIEALDGDLATANALQISNRLEAANAKLVEIQVKAEKLGHKPLVAELELQLGLVRYLDLDLKAAEERLHRAVEIAELAGADRIRAVAFLHLIAIAATDGRLDEAERWSRYAHATIERLGNDPALVAELDLRSAEIHGKRGNAKLAEDTYRRAISRLSELHGANSREVAVARREVAVFYQQQNNFDRAYAEHAAVRDAMQALYGPDHVETAQSISFMAAIRYEQKRFEEALALEEEALAKTKQYFGNDHPIVGQTYSGYALKLQAIGRTDAAIENMNRAVAIARKHFGEQHMLHASALAQLALLYANIGKPDDAFTAWQRAVDIYIAVHGGEANSDVVVNLNAMGTMRKRQGKLDEALAIYERARVAIAKYEAPGGRNMPDTLTRIGTVQTQRKKYAEAITVLEQALGLRESGKATPGLVSWTKFELAKALWESNRDRKRAVTLAKEAAAEAHQDGDATQVDDVNKWLAGKG